MSDFLLELGKNPQARNAIKSLGLPIPLPPELRRADGAWSERPLHDRDIVVGAAPGGALRDVLPAVLSPAGANSWVAGGDDLVAAFHEMGEVYGRPPKAIGEEAPDGLKPAALLFDATGATTVEALHHMYAFYHRFVRSLAASGRVVVIGRPADSQKSAAAAAAQGALCGFVRSLAKEIGKKGSTAQLVLVEPKAEDRLAGVLRFLLSPRSAFVTGQVLRVTAKAKAPGDVPWVRPFEGKVALVTGAARGIGAATARQLAAEGAHVVCLDRPADDGPASKVAREINGSVLLVDVADADAPKGIADFLAEKGGVDVVVHNAGVTRDRTLAKMKPDRWDLVLDVNLKAIEQITAALIKGPLADHGRVVCLSSISGIAGNMGQTNYAASKSGVIALVENLAPAVAKRGITVNAVAPGFTETRMTDAMPTMIREVARRFNTLNQGGLPRDIAEAITFFASPGAFGLTGVTLRVCGGSLVGA